MLTAKNLALSEVAANIAAAMGPIINATAWAALAMPKAVPLRVRLTLKAISELITGTTAAFKKEAIVNAIT